MIAIIAAIFVSALLFVDTRVNNPMTLMLHVLPCKKHAVGGEESMEKHF
jgi:hypothetical protein